MNRPNSVKKIIAYILSLALLIVFIPFNSVDAAGEVFTITPSYVNLSQLPKVITVKANQSTFNVDEAIFPVLLDSLGNEMNIELVDYTADEVKIKIFSSAQLTDGTDYELRIGASNGNQSEEGYTYFLAGNVRIQDGYIVESAPISSLPKGYDAKGNIVITGKYTSMTIGQTIVEILSNGEAVRTPNVVSVDDLDEVTKELTFSLNTGLDTGNYDLRIITGTDVITVNDAIVVRGNPAISLTESLSLSSGYDQTNIGITGTNTGFNNLTTISLIDNNGDNTEKAGEPTILSDDSLEFTLNTGLEAGVYTIRVTTGVETADVSFTVAQPSASLKTASNSSDVQQIGFANNSTVNLVLEGTNTNFSSGTTQLTILEGAVDKTSEAISGSPQISGQNINFTLDKSLPEGTYTVKVATGGQVVEDTFEIVSPTLTSIAYNTAAYYDKKLGKGYGSFEVRVVGSKTNFNENTTVCVVNDSNVDQNKISNIVVNDKNNLQFNVDSGLTTGTYEIEIDVDGNEATNDDIFDKNATGTNGKLEFTVTNPNLSAVSPNTIINTNDTPMTISVLGTNTHFTASENILIKIEDTNGNTVGTISNITAVTNTNLSFNIVPSSIVNTGTYDLVVEINNNSIVESLRLDNALNVGTSGISTINPSTVYKDETNSVIITITGEGTSFDGTTSLYLDDISQTSTNVTETSMEFGITPSNLTEGTHQIKVVESGKSPYITSLIVNPVRDISFDTGGIAFDYESFRMYIDSQGTIDFSTSGNKPQITISGGTISDIVIPSSQVQTTADNSVVYFDFPTGLEFGTYNIVANWDVGVHSSLAGLPISPFTFTVNHKYNALHFEYDGQQVVEVRKNENDSNFSINAIATIIEGTDVDVSSKVDWSVSTGNDVVSVNGSGIVTILKDGTATITANYDGQSDTINIIVDDVVVIIPPPISIPIPEPEDSLDNDESSDNEDSDEVSTEELLEETINEVINEDALGIVETEDSIEAEVDKDIIEKALEAIESKLGENEEGGTATQINTPKVVVSIPQATGKNELITKIPAEIISKLSEKKIDLVIITGEVEINIPAGALNQADVGTTGKVSLTINKINSTERDEINKKIETTKINNNSTNQKSHRILNFSLSVEEEDGQAKPITSFEKELEIKVDVSDIDSGLYDKLGVYYIDEENGVFEYVGGKINENGEIVAKTNHFSKYVVMEVEFSFVDVTGHWAEKYIESMAAKNVINGYDSGDFKPQKNVTRAQFAKLIVEATGFELIEYDDSFTDVSQGDWYAKYVATAESKGIITGYGNGIFKPNNPITRLEMAIMLSRTIGMEEMEQDEVYNELKEFEDMQDIPTRYERDVANVVKAGLINGYDNKFYHNRTTSRDQAATVIYRLFNK